MSHMKKVILVVSLLTLFACSQQQSAGTDASAEETVGGGQSTVQDNTSEPDVVHVAVGSPDHTTLVTALKAAEYVDALSNAGPFTVFAPTNSAFDKLPAGTVEGLLKPESKDALRNILEYHVYVGVIKGGLYPGWNDLKSGKPGECNLEQKRGKDNCQWCQCAWRSESLKRHRIHH